MDLAAIGQFILQLGSTGILILLVISLWRWGKPWAEKLFAGHLALMDKLGTTLEKLDKAQEDIEVAQKQAASDQRRHSDGMKMLTDCQQAILAATNETNRILGDTGQKCKIDLTKLEMIHDAVLWLKKNGKLNSDKPEA